MAPMVHAHARSCTVDGLFWADAHREPRAKESRSKGSSDSRRDVPQVPRRLRAVRVRGNVDAADRGRPGKESGDGEGLATSRASAVHRASRRGNPGGEEIMTGDISEPERLRDLLLHDR